MARPNRGHHKIPRTYLQAFTNPEGKVWVADRKFNLYPQDPLHTLTENDYYTIRFGGGTLDVETKFLGGIEGTYATIHRDTLQKHLPVSKADKARLSIFVASMMDRQPMMRESMKKFFADAEEMITHLKGLPDSAKRGMAAMPSISSGGSSISADELLEMGKDVGSLHSSLIPETVVEMAPIIFDMKWTFVLRPENSEPFLTADNPCVMVDPVGEAKYGRGTFGAAPGLLVNDVELTLPLSSDMALVCGWEKNHDCVYLPIDQALVAEINRRTKRHGRVLIGSDKEMLEKIVETARHR